MSRMWCVPSILNGQSFLRLKKWALRGRPARAILQSMSRICRARFRSMVIVGAHYADSSLELAPLSHSRAPLQRVLVWGQRLPAFQHLHVVRLGRSHEAAKPIARDKAPPLGSTNVLIGFLQPLGCAA